MSEPISTQSNTERLQQLCHQTSTCTRCGLSATRGRVVFGEGNPHAPLVFVGEGPGQNEDATGRPFVGRAGELLDKAMAECGITRKHIYICNILKCRASILSGGRVQNRQPTSEEIQTCTPWLDQQLDIIKPLVIVCLGAPAANTLIHPGFAIMRERGEWFTSSRYARYIMATLHPAFILRQEGDAYTSFREALVRDIEAARKKVILARKEPPPTLF